MGYSEHQQEQAHAPEQHQTGQQQAKQRPQQPRQLLWLVEEELYLDGVPVNFRWRPDGNIRVGCTIVTPQALRRILFLYEVFQKKEQHGKEESSKEGSRT